MTGRVRRWTAGGAAALAILLVSACSGTKKPDAITQELLSKPKEQLFEKGKGLIEKKKYEQGRKYLTFVFETYPNDPLGRDALLMVADSFFKQGGTTGYTEARFRYRDYLNRYPGASRRRTAAPCRRVRPADSTRGRTCPRPRLPSAAIPRCSCSH